MLTMLNRLAVLLKLKQPEPDEADRRALVADFRQRCALFRQLISSNNQALEVMSEMEELLQGESSFDLPRVRALCAQVTANVYKMVRCLNAMTGERYAALYPRLRAIQEQMRQHVETSREPVRGPLVASLAEVRAGDFGEVGPKMANLGELAGMGLPVPDGFVVTASGFRHFFEQAGLNAEIEGMIRDSRTEELAQLEALSEAIQERIVAAKLPRDLEQSITEQCHALSARHGQTLRLAVRSSALGEDLPDASFAGQYRTELGVLPEHVSQVYKEIVAGKYGVTAMTYRWNRGIPDEGMALCVGCLAMVDARAGGVAYSLDPLDPCHDTLTIYAALGLPATVVEGSVDSDCYRVSRREPLEATESRVPVKTARAVLDPTEGIRMVPVDPIQGELPALNESLQKELAGQVLAIEERFGRPQDVEWALDDLDRLVFLQSRPLSGHAACLPEEEDGDIPAPLLSGGVPASPGATCGPCFVVRKNSDAFNFPKGSVLVTAQALPRWAPLLSKAVAVVTETGSAAGHLANVAREFGVPAVFGLADAINILEGSGPVTVDGLRGRVLPGCVDEVLDRQHQGRPNLMMGSPVHTALTGVTGHIVPLTLLDPEDPGFAPEFCDTLHDITRFCHEKSVGEIFAADHQSMRGRLSKQLRYKGAALKYWVIDLGGGFAEPPPGKYVDFENITSPPFHILWEGMTAREWSGPPALDAKGFAAVIGQAAANPSLEPSLASGFEIRNYFMITDTFLSLQSRFGFHFCTVEALMGPLDEENYVSFRFKGGAADMERRVLRARLVSELLEEQGFRVELKQDALLARAEALPPEDIAVRIKVLGYVMVHTRQLDMIMKNPSAVAAHARRLRHDLTELAFAEEEIR